MLLAIYSFPSCQKMQHDRQEDPFHHAPNIQPETSISTCDNTLIPPNPHSGYYPASASSNPFMSDRFPTMNPSSAGSLQDTSGLVADKSESSSPRAHIRDRLKSLNGGAYINLDKNVCLSTQTFPLNELTVSRKWKIMCAQLFQWLSNPGNVAKKLTLLVLKAVLRSEF